MLRAGHYQLILCPAGLETRRTFSEKQDQHQKNPKNPKINLNEKILIDTGVLQ